MHIEEFDQQLQAWRKRVLALWQSFDQLLEAPQNLLTFANSELQTAWEELQIAQEELRQQNQELVEALAAAESERQRYQELFEQAPDGYLVTDGIGTIQEANHAATALLNVDLKFLVGKPLFTFFPQEVHQALLTKLTQLYSANSISEWEVRLIPRQRKPIDAALSVAVVRNYKGEVRELRWLLRDVTERKRRLELEQEIIIHQQVEEQLRYSSLHDVLTGLPNRALFMHRLERALEHTKRHESYQFAVLFLDLDRFKVINDSLGHTLGDQLLIAIANRLMACLRPTDTAARLGGDEFTILLEGVKGISDTRRVAKRIQTELQLPFLLDTQEVFATASIGIALSATGYERAEDLLRDADTAMYRAKALGQSRCVIFHPNWQQKVKSNRSSLWRQRIRGSARGPSLVFRKD